MRKLVLASTLFFISFTALSQSIVSLEWLSLDTKKKIIQEKSLCNFQEGDFTYQLKLERSGFQSEEWLPILEVTNLDNDKKKSIIINIGSGNKGERISLASAKYLQGNIYIVGIGNLDIGKNIFYAGVISKDGELKGRLKEIEVPLNNLKNKGVPFVVPGSFGVAKSQFTALLFLPGENLEELNNLQFTNTNKPEIGITILSDKMEPIQSKRIKFDVNEETFNIQNCIVSNEGDIVFITNTGLGKKSNSILFHTHVFKINDINKIILSHNPKYSRQLLHTENESVFAFAYSMQEDERDNPLVSLKVFEKGGFSLQNDFQIIANQNELSLDKKQGNFDLKKMELTQLGVILVGSFYEVKTAKSEKGQVSKPKIKLENYYLMIHHALNGNAIIQSIPVFTENGPFSPIYNVYDGEFHMILNNHQKNNPAEKSSFKMLNNKEVAKSGQAWAIKINIASGKLERELLVQTKEKLRLLTAYGQILNNVFSIHAVEKSSTNDTQKNILKTAKILFH
jgi:hypothetical protein